MRVYVGYPADAMEEAWAKDHPGMVPFHRPECSTQWIRVGTLNGIGLYSPGRYEINRLEETDAPKVDV